MSTRYFCRPAAGAWKRAWASPAAKRTAGNGGSRWSSSAATQIPPRWSGRSVFMLSATAGVLGFGLAAAGLQTPPKAAVKLFDGKIPSPRYASMDEMEAVGRALEDFLGGWLLSDSPANELYRRCGRSAGKLAKATTSSPRTRMICMRTATPSGPQATRKDSRLLLPIRDLRNRYRRLRASATSIAFPSSLIQEDQAWKATFLLLTVA